MLEYENKKDIILEKLKSRISSGEYAANFKFPSEPVMAKNFGVARATLRSALEQLEQVGLIVRVPGKGTFVAPSKTKNGKKRCILILLDQYYAHSMSLPSNYIIPAFEKTCERLNIQTETMTISFIRAGDEKHIVDTLKKSNYSGILLNGSNYNGNEKELTILRKLNIPVLIPRAEARDYKTTGFAIMYRDCRKSWSEGIRHLIEQGHRRIATLGLLKDYGEKEIRGFCEHEYSQFLESEGADGGNDLIKYVKYDYQSVKNAIKELIRMPSPPSAIFCYSDFLCLDVYSCLQEMQLRIPEDIAVMGYCGYPGNHLLSPKLSTIDLQYSTTGQMAADILAQSDKWFGKKDVALPRIVTPYKLIASESTAVKCIENQLIKHYQCQSV